MRKRLTPQEISAKDMEIVDEVCRVLKVRCKTDLYALKILRLARIVVLDGTNQVKVISDKSERRPVPGSPVTE